MTRTTGRRPLLAGLGALALPGAALAQTAAPTRGGTLIYLEQQTYTNLYPPAGGHYPAGGVLNQLTDKLTYQNPQTLEIEPWIAESWTVNANATEYVFRIQTVQAVPQRAHADAHPACVSSSQRRRSASVASGCAYRCSSSTASWPDSTGGRCRPPRAEGVVSPVAVRLLQRLIDVRHTDPEQRCCLADPQSTIDRRQHTIAQILRVRLARSQPINASGPITGRR